MGSQDWSRLGEEVKNIVESAVENRDFKELNQAIGNTVNQALDQVGRTIQDSFQTNNKSREETWKQTYQNQQQRYRGYNERAGQQLNRNRSENKNANKRANASLVYDGRYGKTWIQQLFGIMLIVPGGALALIFLLFLLAIMAVAASGQTLDGSVSFVIFLCALLLGGGVALVTAGAKKLDRLPRFKQYVAQLGQREFCDIKELQAISGKSRSYILKDLRKMIRLRLFRQGHLDGQGTCLMVTDKAYEQYQMAVRGLEQRQQERYRQGQTSGEQYRSQREQAKVEQKAGQPMEAWDNPNLSPEARKVIRTGKDYLGQIKRSNDAIPGEEISGKISRMELVIDKIFKRVEQHPELIDDLRRFMDYYLPTTVKLLKAYEDMDAQPVQGPNIQKSKQEIEDTLDTINQAFENLLDSFFEDAAWDISSDISVLQTMLAQEGLTDGGFGPKKES